MTPNRQMIGWTGKEHPESEYCARTGCVPVTYTQENDALCARLTQENATARRERGVLIDEVERLKAEVERLKASLVWMTSDRDFQRREYYNLLQQLWVLSLGQSGTSGAKSPTPKEPT